MAKKKKKKKSESENKEKNIEKTEEKKTEEKAEEKAEEEKAEEKPKVGKILKEKFADAILLCETKCAQETITFQKDKILPIFKFLKEDSSMEFTFLTDVAGLDCMMMKDAPERFSVVYHLYSFKHNLWIRLKCYVPEKEPQVETLYSLWKGANWLEREVYDMYGIEFQNHPDLRRLLMPDDYPAYPLRKDYPLQGRGERDNFPRVS